jgi:ATP-dependent helicase/DNAse subunit B
MIRSVIPLVLLLVSCYSHSETNPCDNEIYQKGLKNYKSLDVDEFDQFLELEEYCMQRLERNDQEIELRIYAYRTAYDRHHNSPVVSDQDKYYLELFPF